MSYDKILSEITTLLTTYASIKRGQLLLPQYQDLQKHISWAISILDPCVRESLLTHVGCLPILATFLHPHISHSATTNLGKTLCMLAIHDIGETIVGDVIGLQRNRSADEQADERAAVKKLLPAEQFVLFAEFEAMQTNEAKFAKAVDRLICRLREYMDDPALERARRAHFGATLPEMFAKWFLRMERDEFLAWFFTYLKDKMQEKIFSA